MAEIVLRTPRPVASSPCGLLLAWAIVFGLTSAGCREPHRATLLELTRVESLDAHDGARFALHGQGFPTDRPARVALQGVVHRPGHGDSAVEVRLSGAATSAERLEFSIEGSPELMALSPGQFAGSLEVSFAAGATRIRGRLQSVRLALRSQQADARRDTLQAARRGSEWLASLGVTDLELDLERAGVRVGQVEQAGVADLSGLAPGDRIIRLDDTPVGDLADLWPSPGAAPVRLRVERGAASRQVEIALPRARGQRVRAEPDRAWLTTLWLAGLGLLVVWPVGHSAAAGGLRRWSRDLGALAVAGLFAAPGFAVQLGDGQLHVLRGLLPAALVFLAAPLLGPRQERVEGLVRAGLHLSVAFVALATAALLCGTLSPSLERAAGQEWPMVLQPPGLCLVATVHLALRTPLSGALPRGIVAGTRGLVTSALLALLGGAELWPQLGPVASLAALSALVWLAGEWVLGRRVFSLGVLGAAALLGPLFAFAWFFGVRAPAAAATASALTPWVLAALCARAALVRLRARLWPPPAVDPQLAPFL